MHSCALRTTAILVFSEVRTPVKMEPEIWQRLPEDLLDRILSLLPLNTFLTLRPTSKHFKYLPYEPTFISSHSPTATLCSFLVFSPPQSDTTCQLFDPSRSVWRTLPLSTYHAPPSYTLTAISGRRLFFTHPTTAYIVVCNIFPRARDIVKTPDHPWPSYNPESITFLSTPEGSYRMLLLSKSVPTRTASVYDSMTLGWTEFDGFNESLSNQEGVWFQGKLYFITPERFRVISFHMETGAWETPPEYQLPDGKQFVFARLVASGGGWPEKLYLVGGIPTGVKVLELAVGGGGERWVEIQMLPKMMFLLLKAVCRRKYENVYCFWHQGLVCVCCYYSSNVLYYEVCSGTWHMMVEEKWRSGRSRWFSFAPQLSALSC